MVRNVADIYQSGQYSMAARKVKRAQGALNILAGSDKTGRRDTVHISETARMYSKESIVALTASATKVSASDFAYYFDNYDNMQALLDAINFSEDFIWGACYSDLRDLGVLSFKIGGVRQLIPNYAVPRMNASAFPDISARNNALVLEDKGYYCYTAKNGKNYTWTVNEGNVRWAASESFLSIDDNSSGYNYRWEMHRSERLLSALARGTTLYGFPNEEMQEILTGFGIMEGHFTVDAGAGTHHYILQEDGAVIDVDERIDFMTRTNWKEYGYQTGDVFNVYGKACAVDENGYIHVSVEDEFTTMEIQYPEKSMDLIKIDELIQEKRLP